MVKGGKKKGSQIIASKRREVVQVHAKSRRSESSRQWLLRHMNDPYVAAAREDGYRARSAYKLVQLNEQFNLLKPGMRIVDLGAAPGGWCQVAIKIIGEKGKLVALDILPIAPIAGVDIIEMDFLSEEAPDKLKSVLKGKADLVLSDLAPNTTGHTRTDHIRIMGMTEMAVHFALEVLSPDGTFVCKFFQGGAQKDLLDLLKKNFKKVKHAKPPASRSESSETYLVAQGFRGA